MYMASFSMQYAFEVEGHNSSLTPIEARNRTDIGSISHSYNACIHCCHVHLGFFCSSCSWGRELAKVLYTIEDAAVSVLLSVVRFYDLTIPPQTLPDYEISGHQ